MRCDMSSDMKGEPLVVPPQPTSPLFLSIQYVTYFCATIS